MSGTVVFRASARHLLTHPWQTVLAVVGLAVGVAAALSVDLASDSARRAFVHASEAVAGTATHQIVAGPGGLPDAVYRDVRIQAGVRDAAPVVERDVALADHPGRALRLLGVDPFAEAPFRAMLGDTASAHRALGPLLTRPDTALLAAETAAELGVERGGTIVIRLGGERRRIEIVGVLAQGEEARPGLDTLLVTDIATAQELVERPGRIDRIDLAIPGGEAGERLLARVREVLPEGAEIVPAGASTHALVEATRAFRVNLTAMSLLALFVGAFLVYNTMLFAVVQRRELIGTLRTLGVTRREILGMVLTEAAALGIVATAVGLVLGIVLAHAMLGLVSRTINDLYFVVAVRDVSLDPWVLARAAALGLAGSLLASLPPALEATATTPRAALTRATVERRAGRLAPWLALAGVLLAVGGAAVIATAERSLTMSYAGMFIVFLGAALVIPVVALVVLRLAQLVLSALFGLPGRLAARGVAASLSRTGVAIAALAIAVAASVGVTLMITSFRGSVERWLNTSIQADIYVSAPTLVGNRPDATLPADLRTRLGTVPGVAATATSRVARVTVADAPVTLLAIDPPPPTRDPFQFSGGRAEMWRALDDGAVIVSEPFSYHRGIAAGDHVELHTDHGVIAVPVAGVVRHYGSSEGVVFMHRRTYERLWNDRGVSSIAVYAEPGVDHEALARAVRIAAGPDEELVVRESARLREDSLRIFDRTFAVTGVLRLLVIVVAFVGVFAALMALELERTRELAVLRAQGFTGRDVARLVVTQTTLMGVIAGIAAIPIGVALAATLVHVINRRAFGWTLDFIVTPEPLVQALVLAVVAALFAGVYPAWRLARGPLASALREE